MNIANLTIGPGHPTYFIADIASNHDGDLERAKELIRLCARAGANAAKFQHFSASKLVSKKGFESLPSQLSHQKKWKKSVYETYKDASVPWNWTPALRKCCTEEGIHFFSSPYDLSAVDMLDPFVPAYKIGSGDIDWFEELECIAQKGKPVILATGAATLEEVDRAVDCFAQHSVQLAVLQCNTNYTGSEDNFQHLNLRVIETYRKRYPQCVVGLSDHTPGHVAVLGAVTLGASIIEKHFTDDTSREGPDHAFSMDFASWKTMIDATRHLEQSLGDGMKKIEQNEQETQIAQRRCIRVTHDLPAGTILSRSDVTVLRPRTKDAILPPDIIQVLGKRTKSDLKKDAQLTWQILE
jgi:N-acetylneuraminate synthase